MLAASRDHAMISWSSHPEVDKKHKGFDDSLKLRELIRVVKSIAIKIDRAVYHFSSRLISKTRIKSIWVASSTFISFRRFAGILLTGHFTIPKEMLRFSPYGSALGPAIALIVPPAHGILHAKMIA